jgi:hypothetical protein
MTGWLIIAVVFGALVIFWQMLNLIQDMLEMWDAGRRPEAMQSDKERERSSSWQQLSS